MIKNGLLILSVIMAMVVFVLAAMKFNPLLALLSGGYILLFCWVNEVGVNG